MLTIHAKDIAQLATNVSTLSHQLPEGIAADQVVSEGDHKGIMRAIGQNLEACEPLELAVSIAMLEVLQEKFTERNFTYREMHTAFQGLFVALKAELSQCSLIHLKPDERAYYERGPAPFGPSVYSAFPSAREDTSEAAKCLGLQRHTAAVFHLMRSAEVGLRVLAWDRRAAVLGAGGKRLTIPLSLHDWDKILKALERTELSMETLKKTPAREAQFEFYHGAMISLRAFKNKFRNRVMHARKNYDPYEAASAWLHVREFMEGLAKMLTESQRTPIRWGTKELRLYEKANEPLLAVSPSGVPTSAHE